MAEKKTDEAVEETAEEPKPKRKAPAKKPAKKAKPKAEAADEAAEEAEEADEAPEVEAEAEPEPEPEPEPEKKAPARKAKVKASKPEPEPEEAPAKRTRVAKEDRKFVSAATGEDLGHSAKQGHAAHTVADVDGAHEARAAQAKPLRIAAVILWVLGVVAEVLAVVFLKQNKDIPWVVVPLVVDFILVVVGSQLWKKANHIDPPAKSSGFMYWLQTELGLIVAVIAFFPIVILLLTDKNADKKTRSIGTIVAIAALVIAGASGIDYHPATQEALDEAEEQAALLSDGGLCYWTAGGSVYHFNPDCQALSHSAEIFQGDVQTAFDEGKTRGCKFCTEEEGEDTLDLEVIDGGLVDDEDADAEDADAEDDELDTDADVDTTDEDEDLDQAA